MITVPLWGESTADSPYKRPVMQSFDVLFHRKVVETHSSCWWFETPWRSCDVTVWIYTEVSREKRYLCTRLTKSIHITRYSMTIKLCLAKIFSERIGLLGRISWVAWGPFHWQRLTKIMTWISNYTYRQVSNTRRTLVGNYIVDHSDVVGTSPVGAAPTTSSFST